MKERSIARLGVVGALLVVTACGGSGSGGDDDDSHAGAGTMSGGAAGQGLSGAAGASAGMTALGGAPGAAGRAGSGNAGSPPVGGSGGAAGGAGAPMAGGAGAGGAPTPPLSAQDDPSRISTLPDCALAQAGACVVPITRTKDQVCAQFASDWPKQAPTDYMLPTDNCAAATLGENAEADALRRLNFYRWLAALPPVTVNDEWSTHAAACSIIQAHLDDVNHYPPADSACYTDLGGGASAESLLDIGAHTPADAMDDLIWDWGARNLHELGHRWWLLHPGLTQIGLGFSYPEDGEQATCVRDTAGDYIDRAPDVTGVVAYPSYGITPYALISRESHARPVDYPLEWSFTMQDEIDISTATVKVYREGTSGYEAVTATAGPIDSFHGMWIDLAEEPVPPSTYLVLVSGTGLGDFGYRARIERCGADTPLTCDVLEQDCGVAGYGCYEPDAPFCTKSGSLKAGDACKGNLPSECAAGSVCVENLGVRDSFSCAEYCDANDPSSDKACGDVCLGNYVYIEDHQTNAVVGGYCDPTTGHSCDPLASNCPDGQGCYSFSPARCLTEGSIAKGQTCEYSNDCVPGLACIGAGGNLQCEPYCDLTASTGATACDTLCPNSFADYDTFGVCLQ